MWHVLGVLVLSCGLSAGIDFMTNICKDAKVGAAVPNPRDCNSYFVCFTVPLISYCDEGLHFDAARNVCNWPATAKCQVNLDIDEAAVADSVKFSGELMKEAEEKYHSSRAELGHETAASEAHSHSVAEKSAIIETVPTIQRLNFVAIDVNVHHPIDPMTNYDPAHVECRHYGAYFLPHPHDCRRYYLCAFGHMLQHRCGPGTGWSYKRQECELRPATECYASATFMSEADGGDNSPVVTEVHTGDTYTVCYLYADGTTGTPTWVPQTTTIAGWTPSEGTWQPTGSSHTDPQFTRTTPPTTVSATISASTGRSDTANTGTLECPKDHQAYLPHANDCNKYYICIVGMPVLTSCPDGLYWDQKAEFCDLAKNVQCPAKEN